MMGPTTPRVFVVLALAVHLIALVFSWMRPCRQRREKERQTERRADTEEEARRARWERATQQRGRRTPNPHHQPAHAPPRAHAHSKRSLLNTAVFVLLPRDAHRRTRRGTDQPFARSHRQIVFEGPTPKFCVLFLLCVHFFFGGGGGSGRSGKIWGGGVGSFFFEGGTAR